MAGGGAAGMGGRLAAAGQVVGRLQALRRGGLKSLSAAQVRQFDRDGVLLPLRGVAAEEAQAARAEVERLEREKKSSGNSLFLNGHLLYPWQHRLATHPSILDVVQDLIGPDVLIWKCQLWIKEPGSDSHVAWHQDAAYWQLEPPDSVNVWMALSDVGAENGPMQLVKGSHAEPLMEHEDRYEASNLLTRGQVIPSLQDGRPGPPPDRTVSAVLKPGEFSIHHLCAAHGGGPNRGSDRRIGFNITFVPPTVRSLVPEGASAMLVRGSYAGFDHFRLEEPPSDGESDAARAKRHDDKMMGLAQSIMQGADMDKFRKVSEERVQTNVPGHVGEVQGSAAATSLASSLLATDDDDAVPQQRSSTADKKHVAQSLLSALPVGTQRSRTVTVRPEQGALFVKPIDVYSTPAMVWDLEMHLYDTIKQELELAGCEGWDSVGASVSFDHRAATPVGETVTLQTEIIAVENDGLRVTSRCTFSDAVGVLGTGQHTRAVVPVAKLNEIIARRKQDLHQGHN